MGRRDKAETRGHRGSGDAPKKKRKKKKKVKYVSESSSSESDTDVSQVSSSAESPEHAPKTFHTKPNKKGAQKKAELKKPIRKKQETSDTSSESEYVQSSDDSSTSSDSDVPTIKKRNKKKQTKDKSVEYVPSKASVSEDKKSKSKKRKISEMDKSAKSVRAKKSKRLDEAESSDSSSDDEQNMPKPKLTPKKTVPGDDKVTIGKDEFETMMAFIRSKKVEDEKEKSRGASSSKQLPFQQMEMGTPTGRSASLGSTPQSLLTPSTDLSPTSSVASNVTLSSIKSRRGRPKKALKEPDYSDFPFNSSREEQQRWIKAKNAEVWRFKKLTSADADEYRSKERSRTLKAYHDKKGAKEPEIEVVTDIQSDQEDRSKELGRIRSRAKKKTSTASKTATKKPVTKGKGTINAPVQLPAVQKALRKTRTSAKALANIETTPNEPKIALSKVIDQIQPCQVTVDKLDETPRMKRGSNKARRSKLFGPEKQLDRQTLSALKRQRISTGRREGTENVDSFEQVIHDGEVQTPANMKADWEVEIDSSSYVDWCVSKGIQPNPELKDDIVCRKVPHELLDIRKLISCVGYVQKSQVVQSENRILRLQTIVEILQEEEREMSERIERQQEETKKYQEELKRKRAEDKEANERALKEQERIRKENADKLKKEEDERKQREEEDEKKKEEEKKREEERLEREKKETEKRELEEKRLNLRMAAEEKARAKLPNKEQVKTVETVKENIIMLDNTAATVQTEVDNGASTEVKEINNVGQSGDGTRDEALDEDIRKIRENVQARLEENKDNSREADARRERENRALALSIQDDSKKKTVTFAENNDPNESVDSGNLVMVTNLETNESVNLQIETEEVELSQGSQASSLVDAAKIQQDVDDDFLPLSQVPRLVNKSWKPIDTEGYTVQDTDETDEFADDKAEGDEEEEDGDEDGSVTGSVISDRPDEELETLSRASSGSSSGIDNIDLDEIMKEWQKYEQGQILDSRYCVGAHYLIKQGNTSYPAKVIGDNEKGMAEDGSVIYELGCVFYQNTSRNPRAWRIMDKWWFVDRCDVIKSLPDPTAERVSGKRYVYYFDFE